MIIKVLHIITKLELGGAQINTIYTYDNLSKDEFSVFLLSGANGILNNRVNNKKNHIILKELIRSINPIKDFTALFKIIKYIKHIKPDIIHTHSSKAGILGRIAAKLCNVPIIIHSVHGFAFSPNHSKIKNSTYICIEKIISKITSHFIFVSKNDINTAIKHKLIKNNFTLIRSGFPIKKFLEWKDNKQIIKEKYQIPKNHFVCGVIAPFKPQKGLFHLINIAEIVIKKNKNVIFIIAGDGSLRNKLTKSIKEKGLLKYFRLPGFIDDVQNIISIFDLGISTALWEGLPQSLIQLRLMKKTVIASDIPGNKEVIIDGKNGFTHNVNDYKGFSKKILSIINNKELRNKTDNFKDNLTNWDADYMVKEQELLYKTLFEKNKKK